MRMTRTTTAFFLCLALALATGQIAAARSAYGISCAPAADGDATLVSIDVTTDILKTLGGHHEALRLYGPQGQVIPYLIEQQKATRIEKQRVGQVTVKQVRTLPDGSLELLAESEKPFWNPAHLLFKTTVKDFEQQVQIFGATGNQDWQMLCDNGFIFDSSRNLKVSNLEVVFNPGACTRFRILLSQANLERESAFREMHSNWSEKDGKTLDETFARQIQAFQLDGVALWSEQLIEAGLTPTWQQSPTEIINQERRVDDDGKMTTVLTIRPTCYPVSELTLVCRQKNFSREASVKALGVNAPHSIVRRGVRAVKIGGYELDERTIPLAGEVNEGDIEVTLHDGDNPPLDITAIDARIPKYRMLFLAEGDGQGYQLVSQSKAEAPRYDTNDLGLMLRQGIAPVDATAIAMQATVDDAAPPPRPKNHQLPKGVLYGILAAVIAVLGYVIFRTMNGISDKQA